MTRKIISVLIATLVALALFPVVSASAAVVGTAQLTAGTDVYPGERNYTVRVTNGNSGLLADRVKFVDILLPASSGFTTTADPTTAQMPAGWSVTRTATANVQRLTYFLTMDSPLGGIAPGATADFTFPVNVGAPLRRDTTGTFRVSISESRDGATTIPASATGAGLSVLVRVLEVTGGAPTAPEGVTDGSATGGQEIQYAINACNHSRSTLTVSPSLTSNNAGDVISGPASQDIAAGACDPPIGFDIALGAAPSQRTSVFTLSATAPDSASHPITRNLTVQVPGSINVQPNQVSPREVRPSRVNPDGSVTTETFNVRLDKSGGPTLEGVSCTFAFALTAPGTVSPSPLTFNANNHNQQVQFPDMVVLGTDGWHDGTFICAGTDGNDFPYAQTFVVTDPNPALGLIKIDGLAPEIPLIKVTLPTDGDTYLNGGGTVSPRQQTASSDKDTGDNLVVDVETDDCTSTLEFVELRTNNDPQQRITVPMNSGTCVNPGTAEERRRYTGSVTVRENADGSAGWDNAATSFVAYVQAKDNAGNIGNDQSAAVPIDQIRPDATSQGSFSLTTTRLLVFVNESGGVIGGCNRLSWDVEGLNSVSQVRWYDGTEAGVPCQPGQPSPNSYRMLVLNQEIDRDASTIVSYTIHNPSLTGTPAPVDRLKDGAGNFLQNDSVTVPSGILPPLPQLDSVFRNTGELTSCDDTCETAYNDEAGYWTRFGGDDLIVRFAGARAGYFVQVLDSQNRVLSSVQVSSDDALHDVRVPIGPFDDLECATTSCTDGNYIRRLRLVNNAGTGPATEFRVNLDRVLPTVTGATKTENGEVDTVEAIFAEPIVEGTDFASDWLAYENVSTDDGPGREYYTVDRVSGAGDSRTLEVRFSELGPFGGVDYFLVSPSGQRYRDRAGNSLADSES